VRIGRLAAAAAAAWLGSAGVRALETDQFFAWGHPLADASDPINTKVNAEIVAALDRVNERHPLGSCSCRVARQAIRERLHYPIMTRIELWASNSPSVSRFPKTAEEEYQFRHAYLYSRSSPLDPIRWMPPSPTFQIDGIRVGADKLGHLFSVGAWIERPYKRARRKGASADDALRSAMSVGVRTEQTVLGSSSSGVLSLADLEANYQGLLFYRSLCEGPEPALVRDAGGWRLARPFDLRAYVTPEWDESWQPNIYTPSRWSTVQPVMKRYCALLKDPEVSERRAKYAERDRETPTEALVRQLVASGKLADPRRFSIEAVCEESPSPGSGSGPP